MAGGQAESKADFMSMKAAAEHCFVLNPFSTKDMSEWAAVSVDRPSRKPCWLSLNQRCFFESHVSLFRSTFSRILASELTTLIGRKLLSDD